MSDNRRVSVLVPVYNNAPTLEPLCARLAAALEGRDYEVVLVNDGSRDDSWARLSQLASANPRFKAIGLSRNFGQHPAIAAALDHATGDVMVLMDADLEDEPEHIPALLSALDANGVDIVYTEKDEARAPRFTSRFYHYVFSRIVGVSVPRRLGTYRAFTRKVQQALRAFPERHVLYGPLMFFVGFRYTTVPVTGGARPDRSSYSFGKRLRLALNSLVTYTDLPPKLFAGIGLGMVALAFLYSAIVLLQYLIVGQSLPQGLTMIVLLVSGMTGMLMLAIGTLGVYVFRIFQEVLARPRYLVDDAINVRVLSETDGRSRR